MSDEVYEEDNEHNIESASVLRDYSDRKVLILDTDPESRENTKLVIAELLTGASVHLSSEEEEACEYLINEDIDTCVVDMRVEGISDSEFVKAVNNQADSCLVALSFDQLSISDERSRFKLEPLRKLFDLEKSTKVKN